MSSVEIANKRDQVALALLEKIESELKEDQVPKVLVHYANAYAIVMSMKPAAPAE